MENEKKHGDSAVLTMPYGMLPGPDEALEVLLQAQERRMAGIPGIPAEEVIEKMRRTIAKYKKV
jgi:hypothetical protein